MSSVVTNVTGKDSCLKTRTQLPVFYHVGSHVHFAGGSSQKKDVIPEHQMSIKSVKGVSCVDHLSSVKKVTNAPLVVPSPPVGSGLHEFWEKWAALGVSPKVVAVLREGYTLPFRSRPYLTRKPKSNNRWRPILDLSKLNEFLKTQSFKMETPDTDLSPGRGVGDLHRLQRRILHIPINIQSRKYMCFHIQGKLISLKHYLLACPQLPWSSL